MKRKWPLWTLLALGLHALPLALLRKLTGDPSAPPAARDAQTDFEIDVDLGAAEETPGDSSFGAPAAAAEREPTPALARAAVIRRTARDDDASAEPLEPVSPAEPSPVAEARPDEGLSLDALGIGRRNPFVGSDLARVQPKPEAPRPTAKQRLERSMADAQLRADHAKSLGPAGPVLSALVRATRNGETPANSSALFSCVADASGKLVGVELLESDSDPTPWRRIARRVLAAMSAELLRLSKTGHGAVFRIRVTSRQTLPSGADPGLDVTLLGIPLQHGDGERSGRIEILNPIPKLTVTPVTLPSGQVVDMPTLSIGNILSVAVDPVDIGAPAQRVVHAHVEAMGASE